MRFKDLHTQLELLRYNACNGYRGIASNEVDIFTRIFSDNAWGSEESRSGPGSTMDYTATLRAALPVWIETYGIRSLVDAPCGDFNWFQAVALGEGVAYVGADLVPDVVRLNQARHSAPLRSFVQLDVVHDPLPDVDLWFCRDLWFHLSYCQIAMAVNNFLDSTIRYLATTTHHGAPFNFDIGAGGFRLLNLQKAPFFFPKPIATIEDWIEGHQRRRIGLWSRESLLPLKPRMAALLRSDLGQFSRTSRP